MPVLNRSQLNVLKSFVFGQKVERATATLPGGAAGALFTISGGRVAMTLILGTVTTVIQTQANNTKLVFNPTATGASTDLCAVLDTSADAVGTIYTISGVAADALRDRMLNGLGMAAPVILSAGTIDLDCAATNTGSVAWTLCYVPIDDGATVVAA